MTSKRLQLYYTDEMMEYFKKLSSERKSEGNVNHSISAIGSEILELGYKVHKLQQEKNNDEVNDEFDLVEYLKDMSAFIINASTYSKAAYSVSDSISREAENKIEKSDVINAEKQHLEKIINKHFSNSE